MQLFSRVIFSFFLAILGLITEVSLIFAAQGKLPAPLKLTSQNATFAGGGSSAGPMTLIGVLIAEGIKYTGILAMISLTIGGMMYLTSYGADAKIKKAKNVIIFSLIGVFVSVSAFMLVDLVNSVTLNQP